MRKLGMVLVLFLVPSFAWGHGLSFLDNQEVYSDTALVTFDHRMLTETGVEKLPSTSSHLVVRADNRELQNPADFDEPEEDEGEPEGSWTIGEIQLITQSKANPTLKVRSAGPSSLNSYNFVGKVGGMSFEQVAIPDAGIAAKAIQLSYDHVASDGTRLVVKVGTTTLALK